MPIADMREPEIAVMRLASAMKYALRMGLKIESCCSKHISIIELDDAGNEVADWSVDIA